LKLDSIFAVASKYSKLIPVVLAACLIAPAIRIREGSTLAVAVAFEMSTDMMLVPVPRETPAPVHTAITLRRSWLMAG
jgi:hypothetical protein